MVAETHKASSSRGVVLFMVAAVVFAAIAGILVSRLLGGAYAREPVRPVVVAARDIPAGDALQSADLRLAQWPVSSIPRGAYDSIPRLLKRRAVPLIPLAEGAAVLSSQLSELESGLGVAAKLPGGQRAVAVPTDEALSVARLLYPGARVDVLTTFGGSRGIQRREIETKVFLQNVLVLAVGPNIDPVSANRGTESGPVAGAASAFQAGSRRERQAARRVVTLAVTPQDAERLVLAVREGRVDLVLRSPKDDQTVPTPGATPAAILGGSTEHGSAGGSPRVGAYDDVDSP